MTTPESIIIGIVEGLTEFLPISSTAHMVITESILGISTSDEKFVEIFTIAIQLGAILSIVFLYWKKFFELKNYQFYLKLIIAVIPALVLGKLFNESIDALLKKPLVISGIMILGGIVFLFIDNFFRDHQIDKEEKISLFTAFRIGLFQCLSIFFPGLSRSASTIIGGMSLKLSRSLAAEFSFFLAVPTMAAATFYSLFLKNWNKNDLGKEIFPKINGYQLITESTQNTTAFIIGNVVAFVVALFVVKFFIGFLQKHGFKIWGYYRILVGVVIAILILTGVIHSK